MPRRPGSTFELMFKKRIIDDAEKAGNASIVRKKSKKFINGEVSEIDDDTVIDIGAYRNRLGGGFLDRPGFSLSDRTTLDVLCFGLWRFHLVSWMQKAVKEFILKKLPLLQQNNLAISLAKMFCYPNWSCIYRNQKLGVKGSILSVEQTVDWKQRRTFEKFDEDRNGSIDFEEFANLVRTLGSSEHETANSIQ